MNDAFALHGRKVGIGNRHRQSGEEPQPDIFCFVHIRTWYEVTDTTK